MYNLGSWRCSLILYVWLCVWSGGQCEGRATRSFLWCQWWCRWRGDTDQTDDRVGHERLPAQRPSVSGSSGRWRWFCLHRPVTSVSSSLIGWVSSLLLSRSQRSRIPTKKFTRRCGRSLRPRTRRRPQRNRARTQPRKPRSGRWSTRAPEVNTSVCRLFVCMEGIFVHMLQ